MDDGPARVSFLDNHDMDRFLFVADQDRHSLKLAALALFTLGPTPVLYYGTEIGATHSIATSDRERGGDALVRQDMEWDSDRWDRDLLDFFRSLIAMRRAHLETILGRRRRFALVLEEQKYAYELSSEDERSRLVVAFNLSDAHREVVVEGMEQTLVATRQGVNLTRAVASLPPRSGAVFGYRW